jgi:methyl-accepting chemotaxis protein
MDDMTQQNAALVEQAAAAAASLHDQTVTLAEAVAVFKIDEGEAAIAPAGDDGFQHPSDRRASASPMRAGPPPSIGVNPSVAQRAARRAT